MLLARFHPAGYGTELDAPVPRWSTRLYTISFLQVPLGISGSGSGGQDHLQDCRGIGSQESAKSLRLVFPRRKRSAEGRTITEGHRQVAHGGEPAVVQQGPKCGKRTHACCSPATRDVFTQCLVEIRVSVRTKPASSDGRLGRRTRVLFACDMKYVVLQSEVDLVPDAPGLLLSMR